MCGIAGFCDFTKRSSLERVRQMTDMLSHRGPDDSGYKLVETESAQIGLGHRRLSIIDLSSSGHQPMVTPNGRYIIVFNGEIYNYLELRNELEKQGYTFQGSGDTEVVLAAYQYWGKNCITHFNGMFALAILDTGNHSDPAQLFIARDRTGKKPFYYFHQNKLFEFASELKALENGKKEIEIRALNFYLALGYIPNDLCIIEGVKKLPPAHAGIFRPDLGKLEVWKYWHLPENSAEYSGVEDVTALVDEAEALLNDSVNLRLRSDVPIGVLLSGGLDSSLLVAAAAKASSKPIKTFTMSFPNTRYDEASYAAIVAQHFGTEHHVLEVAEPSLDTLFKFSHLIDEPLADSSLLPAYMVSELTSQQVKVALGGDGGDELFGGYSDYTTAISDQERIAWIPHTLLKFAGRIAGSLPAGVKGRNRLFALQGGAYESMIWGSPYFDVALRGQLLSTEYQQILGENIDEPETWLLGLFMQGKNPIDKMTRTHFKSILPDDFLVKVDRTSMANSLELRAPFLDYRLIEFAFRKVPSEWKVKGNESRRLQKLIAKRVLPLQLDVNRKQGFSIPLDDWLRSSKCAEIEELRHWLPEAISQTEINKLIAGHLKGRANGARIFSLMMLALAQKNNIERNF